MTLQQTQDDEITRMNTEARFTNELAADAKTRWEQTARAAAQAEKEYHAAQKMADANNAALIKALGGG